MQTYSAIITDAATAETITTLLVNADDHMDAARIARNLVDDSREVMVEVSLAK